MKAMARSIPQWFSKSETTCVSSLIVLCLHELETSTRYGSQHGFVPGLIADDEKLYFEHAEEYGPLLNLKVAQKPTRSNSGAGPISMVTSAFHFFEVSLIYLGWLSVLPT
jgi:hypothetical protein